MYWLIAIGTAITYAAGWYITLRICLGRYRDKLAEKPRMTQEDLSYRRERYIGDAVGWAFVWPVSLIALSLWWAITAAVWLIWWPISVPGKAFARHISSLIPPAPHQLPDLRFVANKEKEK